MGAGRTGISFKDTAEVEAAGITWLEVCASVDSRPSLSRPPLAAVSCYQVRCSTLAEATLPRGSASLESEVLRSVILASESPGLEWKAWDVFLALVSFLTSTAWMIH